MMSLFDDKQADSIHAFDTTSRLFGRYFNTFTAKRDCSRIYRTLPNATPVEI